MATLRIAAVCMGLLVATPALAEVADGKWTCTDYKGKALGTLELTGLTYAFTKPDGTAAEGGTIYYQQTKDPAFVVEKGGLQTEMGAIGAVLYEDDAGNPVLGFAVESGMPVDCAAAK
jgi:hypothetical protein